MEFPLIEMTIEQVINFNKKVIADAHRKDPKCQQQHAIGDKNKLEGCLGGIFYRGFDQGYMNWPIEKMAGLMLFRLAEGQFFLEGNKRTAVVSSYFFLFNNGYILKFTKEEMSDLMWGFAADPTDPLAPRRYTEKDAIRFVLNHTQLRS